MGASKIIGAVEIYAAIEQLAAAISNRHGKNSKLMLLGIANGGVELSRRLAVALSARCGTVDISFHRDDLGRHPIPKEFAPTQIPGDVNGAKIILIDDVLFTGRTIKAALDELFDHGRPACVELAVLIDRGGCMLPVAANYTGTTLAVADGDKVVVLLDPVDPRRDQVRVTPAGRRSQTLNPNTKTS